jgi:phage terminase small subunit
MGKHGQQDLFIDAPLWDEGLTGRQRRFVEAYCTERSCFLNATGAFIKAYSRKGEAPPESSVQSNSARMMRNPKIKDAIQRLLRSKQNEDDKITEYEVLKLLHTLTFYNPADIVDRYGTIKVDTLEELGDLALCVTGIKTGKSGREIKLYDRTKALSILAEYLKLIRPQESQGIVMPVILLTKKELEEELEQEEAEVFKIKPAAGDDTVDAEYIPIGNEE